MNFAASDPTNPERVRVIFLNRFYWPDEPATAQLLTDLAETLAAGGRDVTVITSNPDATRVARSESHHGVRIERVPSSRAKNPGLIRKAIDFVTYHIRAMVRLGALIRRGDIVVAMTDPPLLGINAWLVSWLHGARLIHWVQDIYPEIAVELTGHRWLTLIRPLRNLAWRRADHCVTVGTDMAAVLSAAGVERSKLAVIPNWAPAGLAPQPTNAAATLRTDWNLGSKFVVAYSGNLGRVHDLEPVLDLAEALRNDTAIAIVFIGSGAQRAALESTAKQRGLSQIHFRPSQPRDSLAMTLAVGDVHLVTLRPGCEYYVFPSKLYGVAAIGRPVIALAPSGCELARLVAEHGFGRAFDRAEITALAAEVRALSVSPEECVRRGKAAVRFAQSNNVMIASSRWTALLNSTEAC